MRPLVRSDLRVTVMTVGAELARREVPLSGVSAAARDLHPKGTVVHGHSHVDTSRPGAGQRRRGQRPDVTFPTAVLDFRAISEFPKWRKYLISLSFLDKSSVRPVQVGGFEANIVVHRSTAVRGRGGPPPPWESSCRTRTGPVEADGTVDAQNAPTAPWKTLRVFHELPQGLSHRITHAKPRKAPKWRWETRIDPIFDQ